ncbi:phage tail tape measure protein [Pseudomonas knackmussii]|uniref:phage tail tape measure protein n=1 Tax=Pseudomonas knackmussii TaxID=65741 RepID=UPI003F4A2F5E
MGNDLQLRVLLGVIDKALGPLKQITQGSTATAKALKATRDAVKQLNATQQNIDGFKQLQEQLEANSRALGQAREQMAAHQRAVESQRTAQQALAGEVNVHRAAVRNLQRELVRAKEPNAELSKQYLLARDNLTRLETRYNAANNALRRQKQALKNAGIEVGVLNAKQQGLSERLTVVRGKLDAAGISTERLADHEASLAAQTARANAQMAEQKARLEKLGHARAAYEKSQAAAGKMAVAGAAGMGIGYAASRPVSAVVQAFAPNEDAATQLKASMMKADGSVSAEFQKVTDLAKDLGDRLPGTTADFQNMMTMLRRQGQSEKSILGGTGEATAYLGVQLKLSSEAAAEFSSKMQDATRTSEKDMMGLMDTIQRTYYAGVDPNNMLQGYSKISPVMNLIKKDGLEAANAFAPLLVMMDQASMEGGAAGNAFRKIFQGSLNRDKLKDANDLMAARGQKIRLDFSDGKGEFGGIENMYAQLAKLKELTTQDRLEVIKTLYGDDAETMTTLDTMVSRGLAGYREIEAKLKDQADLRTRVNLQLDTLSNVIEAAEGSWTNAMAEFGAAVAPELKGLIRWLGELANGIGAWARANPQLAGGLVKVVALVGALAFAGGALSLTLAGLATPFAMLRYGWALLTTLGGPLLSMLFNLGRSALPLVGQGIMLIGRALLMNPIGLAITAIALGAYLIYRNWDAVKAYLLATWEEIKAGFGGGLAGMLQLLANFSPLGLFYRAFAGVLSYCGIELPAKFSDIGANIVAGLWKGLKDSFPSVASLLEEFANKLPAPVKKVLGIHSPSRVFAELGGHTMAGLEQGLTAGQGGPLAAVTDISKRLAAAGALVIGTSGPAVAIDTRPPLSATTSAPIVQGDTYNITINAGPGTDTAALRRMIDRALAEHEGRKAARLRSRLGDLE